MAEMGVRNIQRKQIDKNLVRLLLNHKGEEDLSSISLVHEVCLRF